MSPIVKTRIDLELLQQTHDLFLRQLEACRTSNNHWNRAAALARHLADILSDLEVVLDDLDTGDYTLEEVVFVKETQTPTRTDRSL